MNRTKIESFAKAARNMLQDQIKSRIEQIQSGSYSIATIERPEAVKRLNNAILKHGLKNVVEEYAYTWFNRLCAIRFMDSHNYNQTMVITPKEGRSIPEILADALDGVIDECVGSQDRTKIAGLLSGDVTSDNAQSEVFRILLVSKCKSLSKDFPFLFESSYDDFSDILLPDDLLSSGSIIAKLLDALDDENCENVEVIGWLYQYYISEKKDAVFDGFKNGKKATAEDIPAATQLFTPDWIVRYLVENSIGRLWILNHPESTLADKMEFYIKPAQQETEFVRIDNPEDFRICDPCCGSGHMLTYSFDILMEIYEEYGYSRQDAVASIIKNNLYGIELDKRAGQLTYFALKMKAREKDRRFFSRKIEPNVCVLEAVQFSDADVHSAMGMFDKPSLFIMDMLKQFEQADTFGSLIVPTINDIDGLKASFEAKSEGYLFDHDLISRIEKVLKFSEYLSSKYDVVITNPPYMGINNMGDVLYPFINANYAPFKHDLYCAFISACNRLTKKNGYQAMITQQSFMFNSRYEKAREEILRRATCLVLLHLGARAFESIGGEVVQTVAFVFKVASDKSYPGIFVDVKEANSQEGKRILFLSINQGNQKENVYIKNLYSFKAIDGCNFSYWMSEKILDLLSLNSKISHFAETRHGLVTGNGDLFMRFWQEVSWTKVSLPNSPVREKKWFPYNKGGIKRRWYGNRDYIVNWQNNGRAIKSYSDKTGKIKSSNYNDDFNLLENITWSDLTTGLFSARYTPCGALFDTSGPSLFFKKPEVKSYLLAFMNTCVMQILLNNYCTGLHYSSGAVGNMPFLFDNSQNRVIDSISEDSLSLSKADWDSFEASWDFKEHPLVGYSKTLWDGTYVAAQLDHFYGKHIPVSCPLELCFLLWQGECNERFSQLKANEEELNRIFIDIYGLQDELTPEESDSDVTVRKADLKRDMQSFVSYAVGCMFGRYSLDYEGLAYAGGEWDESRYSKFKPDDDNVIPVLDDEWFSDDIVARFKKFVKVVFGSDTYDANLRYVEKALGRSLRDYFMKDFYSNHLKIYQKRPIYWMFSSPDGSFNALVYLHRYNRNTVDVVLKYLRDYKTKIRAQIAVLKGNNDAQSVRDLMKYEKIDKDLDEYEQMLYSLALKHVDLDLDDGVKVNYGKLGNALYPVDGLNREKK